MPRLADHDERRQLIADALARTMSTRGPDAVSLRDVAAAAGVTTGTIQHYFRNKDEMLLFALGRHSERMIERLQARAASAPDPASPRYVLRSVLLESLPLDDERALEARVAIAFMGRALADPGLAALFREHFPSLRDVLAEQLRLAGTPSPDADHEAELLLCVVNGLRNHILIGQTTPESAVAMLDSHLDRLIPS
ncbi:TetR/AcrR family transcriptional regulator [Spirillospora sp. CA-294931]|uniref:TetR/AcrR family transcriptional regulator n=1 Tax=Spirillospora sp. CA-294931 TaxID=3240042 RepID=UPI003D942B1D